MSVARSNPVAAAPISLETRVANRKRELIEELLEHKKNSCRSGAADAVEVIKGRLTELAHIVKQDVADGWANVGPDGKRKLDEWIER